MKYELSVFRPLSGGEHVVHVYTVEVDQGIDWVRKHADEIAVLANGGRGYDALNVKALELA